MNYSSLSPGLLIPLFRALATYLILENLVFCILSYLFTLSTNELKFLRRSLTISSEVTSFKTYLKGISRCSNPIMRFTLNSVYGIGTLYILITLTRVFVNSNSFLASYSSTSFSSLIIIFYSLLRLVIICG